MNRSLDRAIAELVGSIPALRAVVLSVAPDGLIAWCWSRDGEAEIALGFARLDRAATACLESLDASRQGRSLMLNAKDTWIVSWPMEDDAAANDTSVTARMVMTAVFSGELQNGMVLLYGRRVLAQLRDVLQQGNTGRAARVREQLVELVALSSDPGAAIERLASDAAVDLRRLERLEALAETEQQRLEELADRQLRRLRIATV